jgi:hypothetical protein
MTGDRDSTLEPDDSDGSRSEEAPVDRRDFLRTVAAGVALDRTVLEENEDEPTVPFSPTHLNSPHR